MSTRWLSWVTLTGCFLLTVSGCGGGQKFNKVEGVLKWKDGTPIEGAQVTFHPVKESGMKANGLTGKDGRFELTTKNSGDGAQTGEYLVTVTKNPPTEGKGGAPSSAQPGKDYDPLKMMKEQYKKQEKREAPKEKNPIPKTYADPKGTPLKWTIEPGTNQVELKL